ncbi:MAG: GNAT family N-acetyltransferase [Candidatus Thorarchaeota archaeon]
MKSEYNLRPMTEEDWDQLREMEKEIFEEDPFTEDQFYHRIERGNFFALEMEGKIIGELALERFGADGANLGRVGIAKSHQGQGLGSYLMECTMDWLRSEKDITKVHLYTQDYNKVAQSLYKKFGFEVSGTTWHYIVPFASLQPVRKYTCQEITEDEIETVAEAFPTLPAIVIKQYIESDLYHVLTLKDKEGQIVGACRFTPSFPGCFPFEITNTDNFDDFIAWIEEHSLPEFDYVRTIFTDNEELAELCGNHSYPLHHRLYKMTLNLDG